MIVVADTSVILNLCRVQHEHLLQQLFQHVLIPVEVAGEFTRLTKIHQRFFGLMLPNWIEVASVPQALPLEVVRAQLDLGESAAITLCLKQKADLLLIDEAAGRDLATQLGVRTIGILGVLVDARNQKLFSDVKSLLDRLEKEAGFWISLDLRRHVLQLTGE